MLKAYKYRLYPSQAQELLLEQTLETCRRWYNTCLAERKDAYENEKRSVGKFEQLRKVRELKQSNPDATNVHSHILQVVVQDLDKAFQAFFRRVKAGETVGYPRFKGCNRFDSFGLKEYGNGFKVDGRRLKLSGMGRLRVRWHRPIEGTIKTVRICRQAGKWYASFACEVLEQSLQPTGQSVGVDVGIQHLLATSDNEIIDNPRWYRNAQAKLRILQRKVCRRTLGGNNRRKAVLALQCQHEYISNSRKDFLNKVAHSLIVRYDFIALENLPINGMVRNHHLSKSILDAGWGYLKQRVADKAVEAGRQVVLVNPSYTSQDCSNPNCRRPHSLSLSDRWFECECGLSIDRDVNAALNILWVGHTHWDGTWLNRASVSQEAPPL
ncbi:MAG: RNA-guided endonuclease InsQ/TnpB family protein [Burkholderiaceae bacterium]